MLELIFSALITILPDYLYRRYRQGKRLGEEITLFSVWYELRWGITSCTVLAVTLITVIFYFHPTTTNITSLFRTVTILSDTGGRVEEVFVRNNQTVLAGDPIFRLDTSIPNLLEVLAGVSPFFSASVGCHSVLVSLETYWITDYGASSPARDILYRAWAFHARPPGQ